MTAVEPGPYATVFAGSTSRRTTNPHPDYADAREATAKEWVRGAPEPTAEAILTIVYAERLRVWQEWAPITKAASGTRVVPSAV
ncbi:hypothetical protein EV191_12645 [Tamaricihabitans halophyticus]|uniref:Uncharacterized protein n=1 Tax=Tamaricihabitans halophyticus TaxID=1262583 RepID=A0A4R2Q3M8_9PSEU|nr:hypothetical protein [Tamaricihabitans halophyticus]TCP41255.1 hypothetical protein EV191_12645 [Tamaricihabitans halophyticus]